MRDSRRSQNYSYALFSQGTKKTIIEEIYEDLELIAPVFADNKHLSNFLYNPAVPFDEKKKLLKNVLKIKPLTLYFLFILTKNKALNLLSQISDKYKGLKDNSKNIVPVNITSAFLLDKNNRSAIKNKLDVSLKKDTACTFNVDPSLIAGFTVQYGDNLLDGSIRSQLKAVKEKLSSI
jgi:F-type H+-transporting ATPase subunit delta